jgi:hypothetical protein
MNVELKGFYELKRNLDQLQKALHGLQGEVARLHFDPHNRQEVDRAIRDFERKVDSKVAPYGSSPMVREMVAKIKQELRKDILKKAEEARRKSPA